MKKKFILIMIGLIVIKTDCIGSDTFELLSKTENALPERARYLGAIVERRSSSMAKKIESFNLLQQNFKQTWAEDLNSIETVAPSDNTKAIFFKAAEILSRKDYADFLMMTCRLVKSGEISKQQLKWGLFPAEKHLREMWIENPPNNSLKDLAYQASLIFADDKGMKDFLDGVISGQVAIDSIGKDEKSLSATPTAYKQQPDKKASEATSTVMRKPNAKPPDTSAIESITLKVSKSGKVTFIGIIGVIVTGLLIWHWKSKSNS